MKTKSGILFLTKTERAALASVAQHCRVDLSFGGGGTFSKGDNENSFDEKEGRKAKKGIDVIDFILQIT